jgi:hypothetical protein
VDENYEEAVDMYTKVGGPSHVPLGTTVECACVGARCGAALAVQPRCAHAPWC